MIPKVIHYCWFGGRPIPRRLQKCIDSWTHFMPDVCVVRWDESNYAVDSIPYIAAAYRAKRWAFVSDYARLDIIFREGGIYLDTDVELLMALDPLLHDKAFCARENSEQVNTGLIIAAEAGNDVIRKLRDAYLSYSFPSAPCTVLQTEILRSMGMVASDAIQHIDGLTIYPQEYFNAKDKFGISHPTPRTFAVHHAESSWMPLGWRFMKAARHICENLMGERLLRRMVALKRKIVGEYS